MALAINAVLGHPGGGTFMGLDAVGWASYVIVALLQVWLFTRGIDAIARFLNFAGPAVYAVMVVLLIMIWVRAGDEMIPAVAPSSPQTRSPDGPPSGPSSEWSAR